MITLTYLAVFAMFILVIMSLVSNSGEQSIENIEAQMYLLNCPDPIFTGIAVLDPFQSIVGFRLIFTVENVTQTETNFNGTQFICHIDEITGGYQASLIQKQYGGEFFGIPFGWFTYAGDWLSGGFAKVQAFFTLLTFVLTPVNFDVLGFTLADLSGTALMVVIALYAFAYIFIGAWLYKTVSPFAGGGG